MSFVRFQVLGHIAVVLSIVFGAVAQSWTARPFNPPAIPLAVKTPYLNSWLPQGQNPSAANDAWATFWNEVGFDDPLGTGTTEFYAGVNVDGVSYRIFGDTNISNVQSAEQIALDITATRTSFLFAAGTMEINATFLSPIDLSNLTIMSRPTTYFYVSASSADGKSHRFAAYSDISSQWAATSNLNGSGVGFINDSGAIHLFSGLSQPPRYSEINGQSATVTAVYSMNEVDGISFEVGIDSSVRTSFAVNTSLLSVTRAPGSPFIDPSLLNQTGVLPVLGIAVEFGSIKQTSEPVVWALTLVQTSDIQYASIDGVQHRFPYYLSEAVTIPNTTNDQAVTFEDPSDETFLESVVNDFDSILLNSIAIDNAVRADGLAISSEYADILALSLRQVMASMEITISVGSDGQWNTSDVMSFMKNMGGLGTSVGGIAAGINCVDILYSAFPVFLYLNSSFGRYLLEPLFDYQDRPTYANAYAAQDLGTVFPNATGNPNPHLFGIEETANMILMTYADIMASGDTSLANQRYDLLKSWGSYLVNTSLIPGDQLAPESSKSAVNVMNMTNLALKGIIGVGAMAQISDILGFSADGGEFRSSAETLISQWQQMAIVDDQVVLSYNLQNTTGLLYNLFADKLLQLNLVPQTVYDTLSVFYGQQVSNSQFGIATSNENPATRADWMMMSAASLPDESSGIRDAMIMQVHNYLTANVSGAVFPLQYDTTTGSPDLAVNSPAVGGMFAVLAANQVRIQPQVIPSSISASATSSSSGVKRWFVIFISVLAGAVALVIMLLVAYFMRRRRQRLAQRRRQTFVRLHDLPHTRTPRTTTNLGIELSPLPNFDGDFKQAVEADTESLSEAVARKGYLEQQRIHVSESDEGNPPSYEGVVGGKVDNPDVKTDAAQ